MSQITYGWQVMLADLSMILFLVTASTVPAAPSGAADYGLPAQPVAPGAVFRSSQEHSLTRWLDERARDPRQMLTVTGRFGPGERSLIAEDVAVAVRIADRRDLAVRTVIEPGVRSELVAVLAFDRTDHGQE